MDPALLKALLIHAAYQGATAVCEPLIQNPDGKPIPIDPLIQDVGLQQKGVLVYEEAKVQYAAILRAFGDKSGIWPDPVVAAGQATRIRDSVNYAAIFNAVLSRPRIGTSDNQSPRQQ